MKQAFILIFFSFISMAVFSQNNCRIQGKISDEDGNPIPYANIYITELAVSSMANMEGEFLMNVECGQYQLSIQSQDFYLKSITANAQSNSENLQIKLKPISYKISDSDLNSTTEDPAYNIIRKAIVMAQYYKEQIINYESDVYVRSFYVADNVPSLVKLFAEEENLAEIPTGDINETFLHYSYNKPNTREEKIIAKKTEDKDTTKSTLAYIQLNFYTLGGKDIINPFNRNSFKVYNFKYIGYYIENNRKVHKIEIIPKRKGTDLMKGFVYLNDGLWNLNSINVSLQQQLVQVEYKQYFSEISPSIWMPINHNVRVSVKGLGLQLQLQYLATLNNTKVKTNPIIDSKIKKSLNNSINDESSDSLSTASTSGIEKTISSKAAKKIQEIILQENLNNRETFKLVRLIKKQRKELAKMDTTKSLEVNINYDIKYKDSAFQISDSLWKSLRKIPLSEKEVKVYKAIDSLNKIESEASRYIKKQSVIKDLFIFNGSLTSKNKKHIFEPNGLLVDLWPYFNTVDGFAPEKTIFDYTWTNRKDKYIQFSPIVGYAVARKTFTARMEIESQYNKKKRGLINISGGRKTIGFNRTDPISDRLNTISTTFFTGNVKKLYQQDYILIDHQIDIINGLVFSLGGEYANRIALSNNSDFKLFDILNREYTPNTPENEEVANNPNLVKNNTAVTFRAKIEWTPKQYYTFKDNRKILLSSTYPTFGVGYRKGIKGVFNSQSDYDVIHFSVQQSFPLYLLDKVNYYFEGGKFLASKSIYFADYQNFNTAPTFVIDNPKINGFRLLDYYAFNTKDYYVEGHFSIENDHILLKYLPLLNRTKLDEKLEFGYLYSDRNIHFSEVGISLTNIFYLMDAGTFVSFKDNEFNSWAIKLSFYFFQ